MSRKSVKKDSNNLESRIKSLIIKNEYSTLANVLVDAFKDNPVNISFVDYLEKDFLANGLETELIELYKMKFYYTLEPNVFEKIGDIYYNNKEYDQALTSYLDCAEISENNSKIYKKLANTFKIMGDEKSAQACMEQFKLIEENL